MKHIQTFYGNPVSEHADHNLDLIGYGKLLAISMNSELNYLAANRYRSEFGDANVFTLQNTGTTGDVEKLNVNKETRGLNIFGKDITYKMLASLLSRNGVIKSTNITEEFSFNDYMTEYNNKVLPMFAINSKTKELLVITSQHSYDQIKSNWRVLGLIYE